MSARSLDAVGFVVARLQQQSENENHVHVTKQHDDPRLIDDGTGMQAQNEHRVQRGKYVDEEEGGQKASLSRKALFDHPGQDGDDKRD